MRANQKKTLMSNPMRDHESHGCRRMTLDLDLAEAASPYGSYIEYRRKTGPTGRSGNGIAQGYIYRQKANHAYVRALQHVPDLQWMYATSASKMDAVGHTSSTHWSRRILQLDISTSSAQPRP